MRRFIPVSGGKEADGVDKLAHFRIQSSTTHDRLRDTGTVLNVSEDDPVSEDVWNDPAGTLRPYSPGFRALSFYGNSIPAADFY